MENITRRELLAAAALAGGAALAAAGPGIPSAGRPAGASGALAASGQFTARPLRLEASGLRGLSDRLIASHYDDHYVGSVARLNDLQARLGGLPADAPAHLTGALKREELRSMNSMILHELYFDVLGGGGRPFGKVEQVIRGSFGSVAEWKRDFKAIAMSLSGGSGWVMLAYLPVHGRVRNIWSADHLVNAVWSTPLIVLDMYEHSYKADFGDDAGAYVDAFFENVDWKTVDRRASVIV